MELFFFVLCSLILSASSQFNPHWWDSRSGIVHLFEWKWHDIANECETFLAPNGFAGVQVSPVTENTIIGTDWPTRPWWERYQPTSYKLTTRSGNEASFADMTKRCNAVGIRIYVDILLNHMSATTGLGTGGSFANSTSMDYPEVPFSAEDFNPPCYIDWGNKDSIRNCQLVGLPDLKQSRENVRQKQVELMNHLIDLGVAGFRVDAMKHMFLEDLTVIFSRLKTLNTNFGFQSGAKPFIVGEVINGDGIYGSDYISLGTVTEFRYSHIVGQYHRGHADLKNIRWAIQDINMASEKVLTFVDNHDNQRGGFPVTIYKEARVYKMATSFHLAYPYGIPRLMSSFDFNGHDQGPPQDANQNLLSPTFNPDGTCNNGWVCEHRWYQIYKMIQFRNVVKNTNVENWWDNGWNKIAFSRGNRGFVAYATHEDGFDENLQTGLPAGTYCDLATGGKVGNSCRGLSMTVGGDGRARVYWPGGHSEGFVAFHVEEKL